jgi:hypothetical protein
MTRKSKQTQADFIRKQGYRRGLKTARDMLVKAKNYQARLKNENSASLLHGLCLRLDDLLKGAS